MPFPYSLAESPQPRVVFEMELPRLAPAPVTPLPTLLTAPPAALPAQAWAAAACLLIQAAMVDVMLLLSQRSNSPTLVDVVETVLGSEIKVSGQVDVRCILYISYVCSQARNRILWRAGSRAQATSGSSTLTQWQ